MAITEGLRPAAENTRIGALAAAVSHPKTKRAAF